MANRIDLHNILISILGSSYVYFQPPDSIKLKYPCFIYNLSALNTKNADNRLYKLKRKYSLTHIHSNPDEDKFNELLELSYCSFDRRYASDNLYHDVYSIYF